MIEQKITQFSGIINEHLATLVSNRDVPSLYEPIRYVFDGKGKRIRPILLMIICEELGGNVKSAIPAAAAIEILHNFTLVHDDIMDCDTIRRGRETVHKRWDESIAILAGDGMMALAYEQLLKTKSPHLERLVREMTKSVRIVCEGQTMDKDLEESSDFSLSLYLEMIRRKTAELIRVSSVCGAIIADADELQIQSAAIYAENIGVAFQIMDDLLEVRSDVNKMGKSLGSDLSAGKKTYPMIALKNKIKSAEFEKIMHENLSPEISLSERRNMFRNLCAEYDIFADGESLIRQLTDEALGEIMNFPETGRKTLIDFAKFVMEREK